MGRCPSQERLAKNFDRALEREATIPARTKRRAKFDFCGRPFVWWVDGDRYLRIISSDKKFVIAVPLGIKNDCWPVVQIIGHEFPGIDPREQRPVVVAGPPLQTCGSMGAWVDQTLRWAFNPAHELLRIAEPIRIL